MYKVGQLAEATGLTVRTLHHYDHVGLLRPSARTSSGHRLYDESDLQRLYHVLALRQVGLSLEAIGDALQGNISFEELLCQHVEYLDCQLTAMRSLRARLTTVLPRLHDAESASAADFLDLIRKVITVDETVQQYFSQEQLAQLAERRERVGEQVIADVQQRWQTLIPRVQHAVEAGTDPASPEAQDMARDWMELLEQFHGGERLVDERVVQMADHLEAGGPLAVLFELDALDEEEAALHPLVDDRALRTI